MEKEEHRDRCWTYCQECLGRGKKRQRLRKKVRNSFLQELDAFEKSGKIGMAPKRPEGHLSPCAKCKGTGITESSSAPIPDIKSFPNVAIIGGGIGGAALAVALLHRGIPFTLYEWDQDFDTRSQGYGLTLQQASKAIKGLGISPLKEAIVSDRHLVHTTEGKIIGEWGMRKWLNSNIKTKSKPRRTNMHIARQSLRLALLNQLKSSYNLKWGHQLTNLSEGEKGEISLKFSHNEKSIEYKADLVVGADGIRSSVRDLILGNKASPLRFLDCIVVLGICPLEKLNGIESDLLDSKTVFQTVNGKERIYMMPFDAKNIMWQLSFPMSELDALELSKKGPIALKKKACEITPWHLPIPQIMLATPEENISGYPVYDRDLLHPELLAKSAQITLLGDAAHPMSPFKGQGANQALLDALSLARRISLGCSANSNWREIGIRTSVLNDFEEEMLDRSAVKVKESANAVEYLHSEMVLREMDAPRGRKL